MTRRRCWSCGDVEWCRVGGDHVGMCIGCSRGQLMADRFMNIYLHLKRWPWRGWWHFFTGWVRG